MVTRAELASGVERAFLDHGYQYLTMAALADAIDVTRRTVYNYFGSKEEAFRFLIEDANARAVEAGLAAGRACLERAQDPVEIFATVLDVRYGDNRRRLAKSPHAVEINDQAFRRCRDLMVASAISFQAELATFITELQTLKALQLRPGLDAQTLAQLLADGARGTNQSLPPTDPETLKLRYRAMVGAILYGAATQP
ncbi:TetR/AcrR family transcriptional regulator [uncultured Bosea sp.]|uniref:TetR/AcrR family transcriptional regulator n=1 Tax=uncultured Bosea sp. TaxID=211457 RepID=UPI0025D23543|nr:TetR/AcrR family transcriptional regulator [uncultured Bosea sp.]